MVDFIGKLIQEEGNIEALSARSIENLMFFIDRIDITKHPKYFQSYHAII